MDESTMSPAERQFRDLMDSTGAFWRRVGQAEGCVEGGRRLLCLQGTRRFGEPDAADLAALDAIRGFDHVEALALRIVDPNVRIWDDLFRGIYPGKEKPHAGACEPDAPASESMVAKA
jgi:hypothetical protein